MRTFPKLLTSLLVTGVVTASAFAFSGAFFSDTETSTDNLLQAGELDLKIDNESYYNGQPNEGTTWELDNLPGHLFFNFNDLKPGDWGEDTISLHVQNNAWACMSINITESDDATCTEPETSDDPNCIEPEPDGDLFDGNLIGQVHFIFWADDGDNVLETDEEIFTKYPNGNGGNTFNGQSWVLTDSTLSIWPTPGPIPGGQTVYIAKAWCFGNRFVPSALPQDGLGADSPRTPANSSGGIVCEGDQLNNSAQTDTLKLDVEFTAIQSRHNSDFRCDGTSTPGVSPTPTNTPTPTPPLACSQADVMLVLDRSGSISTTELAQLKTAADDYIDYLGLSTSGIHAGMSSFATVGSLNHHLSDDPASVKTSINALISSGFTNLKEGIDLAVVEFANPGDGHDRIDGSSPDKMIVITDGHPNRPLPSDTADDLAAASADAARSSGIEVFAVGVGADVNTSYLQTEIADTVGHYYSVSDYSELQTVLQNLDLCQ